MQFKWRKKTVRTSLTIFSKFICTCKLCFMVRQRKRKLRRNDFKLLL